MSIENVGARSSFADVLADHSMVQQAEQLTRLTPNVLKQAEHAAQELQRIVSGSTDNRISGKGARSSAGAPDLVPPRHRVTETSKAEERESNSRKLMTLLAELATALKDAGINKMTSNAQIAAKRDAINNASRAKLAEDYDAAQSAVGKAIDDLKKLKDVLGDQVKDVFDLKQKLADAEAQLALLTPQTPEYDAASQIRNAVNDSLAAVLTKMRVTTKAVETQQVNVASLQHAVDDLFEQVKALGIAVPETIEKDLSNIARMLALMAALGELMVDVGEMQTQTQHEVLKVQQDLRIQKMIDDVDKANKEMAKAEAMSKAMGCVGKILGALATIVGVVGALVTGGASLVLAGIGLAIMAADKIYEGVTGESFMDEALKPLMDLIKPLLEYVMEKLGGLFEKMGLDPQIARMVAMLVVSVVIAVGVAVLSLTGAGSALANFASKVVGKAVSAVSKLLQKILTNMSTNAAKSTLVQFAKQMSSAVRKMADYVLKRLKASPENGAKEIAAKHIEQFNAGLNLTKTVSAGGMEVAEKKFEGDYVRTNAAIQFTTSELDMINDMLTNLLDRLKDSVSVSQNFFNRASEAVSLNASTGVAITRAIRSAASA